MADEDRQEAQGTVTWREYIIRIPKDMADVIDAGLSAQKQMEDREIENSEYWAWLLLLGLGELSRINDAAKAQEQRVVSPGGRAISVGRGVKDVRL